MALAFFGNDGAADVRMLERGGWDVAGVKLVGRPLVVALLIGHGPHQGDVFHDPGRLIPALGDRDSWYGGLDRPRIAAVGRARLRVEGLKLAGPFPTSRVRCSPSRACGGQQPEVLSSR